MSNEIVKYDNNLNKLVLKNFNRVEINLFFAIISRLRDKGTEEITFSYSDLRALSNYSYRGNKRFENDLMQTYKKLLSLNYSIVDKRYKTVMVLFTKYQLDSVKKTITISLNKDMTNILNELASNWTRFSLTDMVKLKSTYAQNALRLFKQYRTTGKLYLSKQDFNRLMDIPKSYLNRSTKVDSKVIRPIMVELVSLFRNLNVEKVRISNKPTSQIKGYRFTWKKENQDADDFNRLSRANYIRCWKNIEFNNHITKAERKQAHKILDQRFVKADFDLENVKALFDNTDKNKLKEKQAKRRKAADSKKKENKQAKEFNATRKYMQSEPQAVVRIELRNAQEFEKQYDDNLEEIFYAVMPGKNGFDPLRPIIAVSDDAVTKYVLYFLSRSKKTQRTTDTFIAMLFEINSQKLDDLDKVVDYALKRWRSQRIDF